ncbi:MAG: PAS domain-containing protein [Proteobacteria bacterium]|nr:PAS domain-containing protein [Pseudomonadota bacterium]
MMNAETFATIYTVFLFVSIIIASLMFVFAWRDRHNTGMMPFMVLIIGEILWMLFCALQESSFIHPASQPYLWSKLTYLGIVMVPASFLVWSASFTHHYDRVTPFIISLLFIEPILFNIVIWTDPWHGWFSGTFITNGQLGIAFWIHTLYSYTLLFIGAIMQVIHFLRAQPNYRLQAFVVMMSLPISSVFNLISLAYLEELKLDFSPVGFLVVGAIMSYVQLRHRLFDILPVARHKVMDEILDGVVVLDNEDRIIDMNPAARRMLGADMKTSHGQLAEKAIPVWDELTRNSSGQENSTIDFIIEGDVRRHIALTLSIMFKKRTKSGGKLILLRDITDRKKAEEELKTLITNLQNALIEIKTLKGIVPICANFKKIRDDEGFWEQVEAYVSKHTDAQFSHSICPDCLEKLYPEYQDERRDDLKQ